MDQKIKEFGVIFWIHLSTIGAIYISPFVLSWRWIILGIFAYYVQLMVLGGCFLAIWQFHSRKISFYHYYLSRFGIVTDSKKVNMVVDYVIPWVILSAALFWQVFLGRGTIL